jgi:hypothetical protein
MDRNGLIQHAHDWIKRLGSKDAVAKKVGINGGGFNTWLAGKYGADTKNLDLKIAQALDYKEKKWVTVKTIANYKQIELVFNDAQNGHIWYAISNKAGSGKTETLEDIYNNDKSGSVLFIQAENWTARQFLIKLVEKLIGSDKSKEYRSIAQLTDTVVAYINALDNPVLLIDEADKLRPGALRSLLPIYNRTKRKLGAILAGTENLEKEIQRGVKAQAKGYDELDSRLGRIYIKLQGASKADVYAICQANGVTNAHAQEHVWNNLEKTSKYIKVRKKGEVVEVQGWFVEDFRRIERLILTENNIAA